MTTFIWQRRSQVAIVLTALTILCVAIIAPRTSGPALATSDGDPYVVPDATDTNSDPDIFETTITAEAHTVNIGNGVNANVLTFNGTIPGPTLRLHVGETVIVHFKNNIAHDTGIHWHGNFQIFCGRSPIDKGLRAKIEIHRIRIGRTLGAPRLGFDELCTQLTC